MLLTLSARYRRGGQLHTESLTVSTAATALLLVDVYYTDQRRGDWGKPAETLTGSLRQMEEHIACALAAARSAGLPVVYAMNSAPRIGLQHSAFGAHFARCWSTNGAIDTFNRTFAEGGLDPREYHGGPPSTLKIPLRLAVEEKDLYVRKHVYSAFFDSRLDTALRNLGIQTLLCAGLWANVCMAATALDALYRNYRVLWLRDGTLAGEAPEDVDANTARWVFWFEETIGYTVTAAEFAAACRRAVHS